MKRSIIKIDEEKCDGCGVCIPACAEGALQVVEGKARLVKEIYCDGLGACLNKCPQGAIILEEREADPFDEEAAKVHLEDIRELTQSELGYRSAIARDWKAEGKGEPSEAPTLLSHWPVKLRLISPRASFFGHPELVVAADCGPFAYGNFHQDFLEGRTVVSGCPKFDDIEFYQEKLTEILRHSRINKIIVARMEVPCCSAWLTVVKNAVASCGKAISIEERVIGIKGDIAVSG
jgi:Fe-S-cluster-containing hydrogenase component 2